VSSKWVPSHDQSSPESSHVVKIEEGRTISVAWNQIFVPSKSFPLETNQNHFISRVPLFSAIALALASDSADSTGFREYTKLPVRQPINSCEENSSDGSVSNREICL
jgi:hypothetical protein